MTQSTADRTEKPTGMTAYHVLIERTDGATVTYQPVDANVKARTANEAIKKTAKETGRYLAIPARSFQPVKVTVDTVTSVKLG